MASIRTLMVSLAAFSSVMAVPLDQGDQYWEPTSVKKPANKWGNPVDDWFEPSRPQHGSVSYIMHDQCLKKYERKSQTQSDPIDLPKDQKVVACREFATQAMFDLIDMDDATAEKIFSQANPGVENPFAVEDKSKKEEEEVHPDAHAGHLHRRQLFPGASSADAELLKDSGKAGIWFAEHCGPELFLAKIEGRKPHYEGFKEKFFCPAIAKTFPHLLPFENPFGAVMIPGPVIDEAKFAEPAEEAMEA